MEISDQVIVSGFSDDGLVEAIERPDRRFAMGVQWHPERLIDETADADALFKAFVATAFDAVKQFFRRLTGLLQSKECG